MNSLDSRVLRHGDTFAQKFSQPGRYTYDFNQPFLKRTSEGHDRFYINVKPADQQREGEQHFVVVRQQENKKLKADPPELNIDAGDVVLWSAADSATPGFSVSGYSENASFHSAALIAEALYTHAFGSAGKIDWEDVNGHRLAGTIVVKMPETKSMREKESYEKSLGEGTLVVISGDKVDPKHVEISVGQTVFFAVEKASGITITDRRLNLAIPVPQEAFP